VGAPGRQVIVCVSSVNQVSRAAGSGLNDPVSRPAHNPLYYRDDH
jgi:hypothetical protein